MAKLFGYPINVEAQGGGGGGDSLINGEVSRSGTQPDGEAASSSAGSPQRETNPYSRFSESGSERPCEIETAGEFYNTGRNQMQRVASGVDICVMEEDEEIELGLGIGAGLRGDSVTGDNGIDSGRVKAVMDLTPLVDDDDLEGGMDLGPFEDDLFCEEEAVFSPVNNDDLFDGLFEDSFEESAEDILRDDMEGSSLMEEVDAEFFLDVFPWPGETTHGDYDDVFAESFNQAPPPTAGSRPASKRVVDGLPVVEITFEDLSSGRIVCAICIGDVVVEEKVTRLPCWHYYHGECIRPWLGMKNTCSVCRFELPTDDL
ncbi:hypothetical protein Bca4012_012008 [Brassica carinata]|uniref:RING-type E3 ubiquitin transferase n=1 Tax=Brassica carinata TaxID=52824 RepID=A0A8X7V1X5_BRACI|nr:hypothetical protein Bca52824_036862 [Brassica carinata]